MFSCRTIMKNRVDLVAVALLMVMFVGGLTQISAREVLRR